MTFPSWLKQPPISTLALPLFLMSGAFFAGTRVTSCGAPAVVTTKDKLEERRVEKTDEKKKIDVKKDEQKNVAKDVERVVIRYLDGRVETRIVDHTKIDTRAAEIRTVVQEKIKTVEIIKIETHEKTVTRRPDWIAGVNAGVSLPAMVGRPTTSLLPLPYSAVVGLSVERRIVGSVYGGVSVNSQGVAAASLKVLW
jgi:hypothetical protein